MVTIRKYIVLFILLMFASMGISITIKAAVGLGAFDAINQTLSYILNIKVGSVVASFQIILVIFQLLILKKDATWRILLQVPLSIIMGEFINFFYYYVFGNVHLSNYIIRLIIYIFGMIWIAFFMSGIMTLNLITVPIESLPMVIANKINRPYGQVRQFFDVLFVIVSLILTYLFSLPLTIREGTVIGTIIFGPFLSIFMPRIEKIFKKWQLIEND